MGKNIEHCYKSRTRCYKDTKNVIHKIAEEAVEFTGNKIAEIILKEKSVPEPNSRNIEEIVISPQKRQQILNKLRQVL